MKRLAIFIGGLLVLPAFGEVAPIFYEDAIEYSDVMYDENGEPILDDEYDDLYLEDENVVDNGATIKTSVPNSRTPATNRTGTNRTTIGRTVPTTAAGAAASGRVTAANSSRAVAARTTSNSSPRSTSNARSVTDCGTTSRTTSSAATRTTTDAAATRAAAARTTGGAGRASSTSTRSGATGSGTVARTASSRATTTARTASTSGARVSRAGTTLNKVVSVTPTTTDKVMELEDNTGLLYIGRTSANSAATGTGRISIGTDRVTSAAKRSSINTNRVSSIRMSSMGVSTNQVDVTTTQDMDELAELTDYCKAQYAACMDNYCNVLDDNQGRCSCSANLKNYEKSEAALKAATEELQEVAQKIQYIGLSAREVETLFSQTEAELKMQSTTDTSQLKTSLDKIKDMIIEVQSGNTTSNTSGLVFDLSGLLDFTIDGTGFDLSSFLGGFGGGNGGVSNQRGAELFKTATNRCKANVLKACVNQGVDASLVTNAYDLEIDKECIEYERNLNDSNDQMVATVRNAKNVLQKARLLVEQSKNEYDMRGCINALDACMQDEYVCGSDYEKCLDPSGRYIVNGEIVIGTDPGRAVNGVSGGVDVLDGDICSMNLYNVWNYGSSTPGQTNTSQSGCKNAWNSYSLNGSSNGNLSEYISQTLGDHDGLGMSQFIQNKIGYYDSKTDKNYGMCMSVLNKCQDYTYDVKGNKRTYNKKNEVVKQYLDRILIQIKARQDELLSEHAESCITDVTTCLSQNNYPFDEVSENAVQANIAINACRSTIVTCMSVNGYSVDDPTPSDLWPWICGITTGSTDCVPNSGGGGDGQTYTYTVTYNCNKANVTNNTTWSKSASGSSTSVSMTFDSSSTVTSKCNYSGFNPRGYRCTYTSSGSTFSVNLGASRNITGNATCNVEWQPDSGNTTCSAGNLSYCTTEAACTASSVGGTLCYATGGGDKKCVANTNYCRCHETQLDRCTGSSCTALGSNYHYCVSGSGGKATCSEGTPSGTACCFGTDYYTNCNTQELCTWSGNQWCSNGNGSCHPNGVDWNTACPNTEPEMKSSNYNGVIQAGFTPGGSDIVGGSQN